MQLLALGHPYLHLDLAVFEVEPERHSGAAILPDAIMQPGNLALVQQQLAVALRVMVLAVTEVVGGDMQVVQPGLAVFNDHKGVGQIGLAGPQGFHLGPHQDNAGLQPFFDMIFVEGALVCADQFLTHSGKTVAEPDQKGNRRKCFCLHPAMKFLQVDFESPGGYTIPQHTGFHQKTRFLCSEPPMTMRSEYSEIYLSSVIGRSVITSGGQEIGTLRDLVMVPGEIFPEVSHLVIRRGRALELLPWGMVKLFTHIVISTTSTTPSGLHPYTPMEGEILVKRDLLDKQIVDVDGAKVVRVNDIKLGNLHDKLCIFSVDIGFRGILRRLGYERLGERMARALRKDIPTTEISWEYVQPIEATSSKLALNIARDQMNEIHPADLADILESIPIQNIKTVLETIDAETTGETLYELEPEMRNVVINQMDSEHAADILEEMEPDEAADVLADLPEQKSQELLELMDEENAEEIQELLEHEDDTAGGLMNSDYFRLSPHSTVGEALIALRQAYDELKDIHYGYIVNDENQPEGVVSIRQLLTNPPELALTEMMEENLVTVTVGEELTETLELMTKYDLLALPVLDEDGTMAGVLTVDDLLQHLLPKLLKSRRGGMM